MTLAAPLACLISLLVGGTLLLATPAWRNGRAPRLATGLAAVSFSAALLCAALVSATGPSSVAIWQVSLHLDTVDAVFSLVIGFVGMMIVQFSGGYLSGEARQPAFLGLLLLTLFFAQLLAMAGDVFLFGLAWVGMSLPVQKLLTYYQRPGALVAARLKFASARASDLLLLVALGLLVASTGSTDIAQIGAAADATAPLVIAAGILLAGAILVRSAQVPAHAWLLRAVEAPTPVSAVLHAGVVNAGGLLALRFAPVLAANEVAMTLLAVISGVSVIVALGAMAGEQRLKSRLAWSTVAQMGFMLLQCSLGLWGFALLHIAAHALYKSFAFLNAGTLMPSPPPVPVNWTGVFAITTTVAAVAVAAMPWVTLDAPSLVVCAVFALGLGIFGARAKTGLSVLRRVAGAAAATMLWLCLHDLAAHLVATETVHRSVLVVVAATLGLAALAGALARAPLRDWPDTKALRLHIRNGFYLDLFVERLAMPPIAATYPETAK